MVQSNSMVQLLNNRTNIVITNEEGLTNGAWNKKNALYSVMFSDQVTSLGSNAGGLHSITSPSVNYKARNSYLDRLESITASVGKDGAHQLLGS